MEPSATPRPPCGLWLDARAELAENPVYDDERGWLYWSDIPRGEVHRARLDGSGRARCYRGPPVGGFTLQADGSLLLFRERDVALLPHPHAEPGPVRRVAALDDPDAERFNDACADPLGGVFAGTVGRTPGGGGLYRLDRGGRLTKLRGDTDLGNGMGFAPDGRTFYWTRTRAREIVAFEVDPADGALRDARRFAAVDADDGLPDGLAVDAEGGVWSARFGGAALVRHAPDGRETARLTLPVSNPTSLAFVGAELDEIVVTTASGDDRPGAGGLFRCRPGVRGRPPYRSRVAAG